MGVDTERPGEVAIGLVVDEDQIGLASQLLGHHGREDVDLIVVGQRHHQFRVRNIGFMLDFLVERTPVENDGPAQDVCRRICAIAVVLDDLDAGFRLLFLDRSRDVETDIAAARNDDAVRLGLLVSEQAERAPHLSLRVTT